MTSAPRQPSNIGPFQILRELGRGGMGVVYLAKDPRLDREVAIKGLPDSLEGDTDRLARFQREAKVLASLSHPNIGAIHGLEEAEGRRYLVLEFINGETLSERLKRGPIPIDECLPIARQIAEAVEAAHEKGIIHRDLKPGNVMITSDGQAKVLDFGLARTADGAPTSTNYNMGDANSPTVTSPMPMHSPTVAGVIMGTAGYMSPEQARGKPVDKRSDIFSFGCVLYEMLTGAGPFPGETVTDSLGAILHREPVWAMLPPRTPARVRELLINCLAKDRRQRLHDMGDARLELERAIAGHEWTTTVAAVPARKKPWLVPAGLVGAAAMLAAGWGLAGLKAKPAPVAPRQTFHVATMVEPKPGFNTLMGISPDARFMVYSANPELPPDSVKPTGILMVRRLDRDETITIDGTEGARDAALSPDGRTIAFSCAKDRAGNTLVLKKVSLENGRPTGKPETVYELQSGNPPSLCWASDREIVFSPSYEPVIYIVGSSGGEPREVLKEDRPKGIESWAEFRSLVPGKSILASRWSFVGQKVKVNTEVVDLTTGTRTLVLPDAGAAQYIPDERGGYLLASRSTQTNLIAVRFDLATSKAIGDPVTVWSGNVLTAFRVTPSGTLALTTRPIEVVDRRLAWVDDKGQAQPIPGMTRSYGQFIVSPDGERVLVSLDVAGTTELISECWVQDLARKTSTRIPVKGAMLGMLWSPDGQQIAYGLAGDGGFSIVERRSDGSSEPMKMVSSPDSRTLLFPTTWSPDGKFIAFVQVDMGTNDADAYVMQRDEKSNQWTAKPYLKTSASEGLDQISKDGKWAIISSSQSGRQELYVQPFTGDGDADGRAGRRQISTSGGGTSWWSPDGKEIRYLDNDWQIMSVQIKTEPAFSASEPKVLYNLKDLKVRGWAFAPDGRLMVIQQGDSEQTTASVGLVINFLDEMRAKLLPAK